MAAVYPYTGRTRVNDSLSSAQAQEATRELVRAKLKHDYRVAAACNCRFLLWESSV